MPSSRESSQPRDRTRVSYVSCTAGRFFTTGPSLVAQTVKNLPVVQEIQVPSLGQEDPLEKGMATHCSVSAWRIHRQRSLVGYRWTSLSD